MTGLPLLALLLLAPGARADDAKNAPPEAHGKAVLSYAGCRDEKDQKTLDDNISRASKKIRDCLGSLNPGLESRVEAALKQARYSCVYTRSLEGGETTFPGGKPSIAMSFETSGHQYEFEARLFHEMIHASDPKHALVNQSAHGYAGALDPVYGCQLACYPGGLEAQEIKMSQKAADLKTPDGYNPKKWIDGDSAYLMDDSEHRFAAESYAAVCAFGKPASAHKSLDAKCLAQAIMSACPGLVDKSGCTDAAQERSASCELLCEKQDTGAQIQEAQDTAAQLKDAIANKTPLKDVKAGVLKQLVANKSLANCNK